MKKITLIFTLFLALISCTEKSEDIKTATNDVPPSIKSIDTVSIIKLTQAQAEELKVQLFDAKEELIEMQLSTDAEIVPSSEAYYVVSAPISGRISKFYAKDGASVQKGTVLAEIESLEFANIISDLLKASADLELYSSQQKRANNLIANNIISKSEQEQIINNLAKAQAEYASAYSKMTAIGLSDSEINSYKTQKEPKAILKIKSEIAGNISQKFIDFGQSISALEKMFTIVNKNQFMARTFIPSQDAPFVSIGDEVELEYNGSKITAKIQTINPQLDNESKSFVANIFLSSQNANFKIGTLVKANIKSKSQYPAIAIPLDAISYEGENPIIFVKKDELNYEKRIIKIRKVNAKNAIIESGIAVGDKVAISQVFTLKAISKAAESEAE